MKIIKILYMTILIITFISIVVQKFDFKKVSSVKNVTFWTLQMSDFSEYIENVITEFETQNPDIKIKWVDVPFSEGEKRTLASVLSNNPPDLINSNPDFSSMLAQRGALYEIDKNLLKDFNQEIINSLKYNDKLYSIPWYATSAVTIYNKDLFTKANAKIPKTYENLEEISPKFAEIDAYASQPNLTENDTMVRILNKYDINSSKNINSPKSVEIFESYKQLYVNNLIPKDTITQTQREALEKFMAGKIATIQAGANFLNMIKENAPQTYARTDIAQQLQGELGQNDFSLMNFIIPIRAKNKQEGLKFALFLTNSHNQLELAKLTNIIATNEKTLQDEFYTKFEENDLLAKARVISASQLKNLNPIFKTQKNQKEINILINSALQEILIDKNSTQKILDDVAKNWAELEKS